MRNNQFITIFFIGDKHFITIKYLNTKKNPSLKHNDTNGSSIDVTR